MKKENSFLHEKTDFYMDLDADLWIKNGSFDMAVSFGYDRIFFDMAVGGFLDLVSNFSGWWFFGFSQ
jgi:hypothetical protein